MQRRCAASRSIAPRHWNPFSGNPCRNSAALPRPRSLYAIRPCDVARSRRPAANARASVVTVGGASAPMPLAPTAHPVVPHDIAPAATAMKALRFMSSAPLLRMARMIRRGVRRLNDAAGHLAMTCEVMAAVTPPAYPRRVNALAKAATQPPLGTLLREWRSARRLSQLDLALAAEVSTRHLSCVESGKAQPSREMIARLADALDMPLRERNALLVA